VWYQAGMRMLQKGSSSSSSSSGEDGLQSKYAPWLPGQCIDCALVGGTADPTGTFCGECMRASSSLPGGGMTSIFTSCMNETHIASAITVMDRIFPMHPTTQT
jgi:hypothetical protein